MNICVYGASSKAIDKKYTDTATLLGEKLAERGHTLVFGGGASGVMGATAQGFYNKNGRIIGVVPKFFNADGILFNNCSEMIYTDNMRERKRLLEEKSEAYIVAPGGVGTFDEFFEILTLKQLGRINKALVIFNVDGYYDATLKVLENAIAGEFMTEQTKLLYKVSTSIDEIIDYVEGYDGVVLPVSCFKKISENK